VPHCATAVQMRGFLLRQGFESNAKHNRDGCATGSSGQPGRLCYGEQRTTGTVVLRGAANNRDGCAKGSSEQPGRLCY
jgi:hypothetical protein